MKRFDQPTLVLNFELSGLPFRLLITSILGVGATAIILGHQPNLFAMCMVILSVGLSLVCAYLVYPFASRIVLGWGMILTWFLCLLVTVLVYLLLPWIEALVSGALFLSYDREITRIYLWILGLFIVPIVLGFEQLVYAQTEVKTLETESKVADLDFRIRPHFLFNSLNSVASLIPIDPVRAEDGLMDLADMFRGILTEKRLLIPFADEYVLAQKYINLEKMRLGDRLRDEWQVEGVDDSILLPTLTLQPIIENAIYHGIETRMEGGKVSIKARHNETHLYITIINPKPEVKTTVRKGNQIAQQNLINRFQYLYRGEGSINHVETDNYYTVTIKVPRKIERDT